jgi:hypothetical protein
MMTGEQTSNPFKIGDRVVFSPNEHAIGWAWSSFDRLRLKPGDEGIVSRIENDGLLIDDERGGFHWECFRLAPREQRISAKARKDGSSMTEAEIEAAEEEAQIWARRANSC